MVNGMNGDDDRMNGDDDNYDRMIITIVWTIILHIKSSSS